MARDSADRELAGMAAYFRDPTPYPLVCACRLSLPGWIDAGCVFHGIKSMAGQWEGEKQWEDFRRAVEPVRRKLNVKWGD